jgi:hypothetical protein
MRKICFILIMSIAGVGMAAGVRQLIDGLQKPAPQAPAPQAPKPPQPVKK